MRVLILTPEFIPVYGGVGNYVLQIVKRMPRDDLIHVVTPLRTGIDQKQVELDGTDYEGLPENVSVVHLGEARDTFYHNFSFQWNCANEVPRLVKELNIDILHSQSAMPDFFLSPDKLGVPIVTTIHTTTEGHIESLRDSGTSFSEMRSAERFAVTFSPILRYLENRYYTNRRWYLTVSEWARRDAVEKKKIEPGRIEVSYIGVDSERFSPAKRDKARDLFPNLAEIDCPKVLFLSRMATRKGVHLLLKAIPRVLEKIDAHFIFAGAGNLPNTTIPKDKYDYLGHLPNHLPPYLYALSDVYVLPSLYENFPASILEAMSSECATVATNVCGIPEMIQDRKNGILIPPNDVNAISDSIIALLEEDSLRRELGSAARESVQRRFPWQKTADKTRDYYDTIIESGGRSKISRLRK